MSALKPQEILDAYKLFCRLREMIKDSTNLVINEKFLYPTTILALSNYLQKNACISFADKKVEEYYRFITTSRVSKHNSYIAITPIPLDITRRDDFLKDITEFEDGVHVGGRNSFNYIISELIDNIYEHSCFNRAYIVCQRYYKKGFFEIVIIDNGKGIKKNMIERNHIFDTEMDYIYYAANGLSTKGKERGKGLGTNIRLVTEGMNGCIFIVSGGAALFRGPQDQQEILYMLKRNQSYDGVLITIRIPYPLHKLRGAFYDYIES